MTGSSPGWGGAHEPGGGEDGRHEHGGPDRAGHGDDGCPQVLVDLGGYVLGALDPAERMAVEEHLARCADCRDELAELAGLPALLGRLSESEAAQGLCVHPSPTMLDDLLGRVSAARRRARRRTVLSVAAVTLVAALGTGVLVGTLTDRAAPATTTTTTAQGVAATAQLHDEGDRTAIDLRIRGVRAGERCRLVVVDRSGRQQVVGEWQVDYVGTARVHATVGEAPTALTELRVVTDDGADLAALSVPARA